jgi:formate/nitrite transporter FocA (FNT family)
MFVLSGYEHSIANMSYIPIGLLLKHDGQVKESDGLSLDTANWGKLFYKNLIPVTLGNIVGGVAVGTSYWFNKIYMVNYAKKVDEKKSESEIESNNKKNDNSNRKII